ncbi:MAG: hypothetical protein ACLTYN_13330 [Dysosmobacter welbionis]
MISCRQRAQYRDPGSSAALPGNEAAGPGGRRVSPALDIGAQVRQGDVAATVNSVPMTCTLTASCGVSCRMIPRCTGMKAGDIDPRCKVEHCYTASDKALAIGGGVLEAILDLTGALKDAQVGIPVRCSLSGTIKLRKREEESCLKMMSS